MQHANKHDATAAAAAAAGSGISAQHHKKKHGAMRKVTSAGSKAVSAAAATSRGGAGAGAADAGQNATASSTAKEDRKPKVAKVETTAATASNAATAATPAAAAASSAAPAASASASALHPSVSAHAVAPPSWLAAPPLPLLSMSSAAPSRSLEHVDADFLRIRVPPGHTIRSLHSTTLLALEKQGGQQRLFLFEYSGDRKNGQLVVTQNCRELASLEPASAAAGTSSSGAHQLLPPATALARSKSDTTDCGRCSELQQLPVPPPTVEALLRADVAAAATNATRASASGGAAAAAAAAPKPAGPRLLVRVTALSYVSPIKDEQFAVRIVRAPDPLVPDRVTAWACLMDVMQLVVRPFGTCKVGHKEFATWLEAGVHSSLQSRVDKLAPSHTIRVTPDSTHNVDWRVCLIRAEGLDQMVKTPQATRLLAKHEVKYKGLTRFITDTLANNLRVMTYGPPSQQGAGAASGRSSTAAVDAAAASSKRSKPSKPKSKSPPEQVGQSAPKRKGRPRKKPAKNDDGSSSSDSESEGEQWAIYEILGKRRVGGAVQYQVHWLQRDGVTPFSPSDPTGITWEPADNVKHMDKVKQWETAHATQKRYAREKQIALAAAAAAAAAAGTKSAPAAAADTPMIPAERPAAKVASNRRESRLPPQSISAPNLPTAAAAASSVVMPAAAAAPSPAAAAPSFSPKPLTCLPPAAALRDTLSSSVTSTSTTPSPSSAGLLPSQAANAAAAASSTPATPIIKPSPSKPHKRKIDAVDSAAPPIEAKGNSAATTAAAAAAAASAASAASAAAPSAAVSEAAAASSALPPSPAAPEPEVKKRKIKKLKQPIGAAAVPAATTTAVSKEASGSSKAAPPQAKRHKREKDAAKSQSAAAQSATAGRDSIDLTD